MPETQPPPLRFIEAPSLGIVECPDCGSEEAVVVVANYGDKGCYCPECEHVWVVRGLH